MDNEHPLSEEETKKLIALGIAEKLIKKDHKITIKDLLNTLYSSDLTDEQLSKITVKDFLLKGNKLVINERIFR